MPRGGRDENVHGKLQHFRVRMLWWACASSATVALRSSSSLNPVSHMAAPWISETATTLAPAEARNAASPGSHITEALDRNAALADLLAQNVRGGSCRNRGHSVARGLFAPGKPAHTGRVCQ